MARPADTRVPGLEELLLRDEVQAALFHEARLLDERNFGAWLELFTDDAIYWIPSVEDEIDPAQEVSIVYDDRSRLRERVWRLESGLAYAQEPSSRSTRVIGNVRVGEVADDEVSVHSTFVVAEFRRERQVLHAGRYLHRLRRSGDGFLIALKKVELVNNNGHLGNLSLPL